MSLFFVISECSHLRACCEQVLFLAASVCLCVSRSVCTKSQNHWSEIDVTWQEYAPWWTLEVYHSWWLMILTCDFESCFCTFWIQAASFEWLDPATSFSIWRYIFRISRWRFSFEVICLRSRSLWRKSSCIQLKNYWSEIAGTWA